MDHGHEHDVLFLGLGAMGSPMATLLAGAGHSLAVHDVDPERTVSLARTIEATAVAAAGLRDAAASAGTVVLMLPDSPAVESVLDGPDGLLAVMARGSTVVDMGSSRPASTVTLAAGARSRGIALVDAPVSGGVARARTGELAIMAGGEPADVDRVHALLSALGEPVHVGPAGAGHAMKALNNLLSAVGLAAASEVLAIGSNFGLDPAVMLDVLNGSTGRNHATEVKMARFVLSGTFDSGFAMRLMVKDLRTALDLAHDTGTPSPLSAGCLEQWIAAAQDREAGADHTEIAAYVAARAGVRPGPRGD
ncbi:NAD(P)-dependent oxidoreductase [Blastococcus saxobsidens]|uniref:3-hydroxyisobutyrate dehydrogenase n=1 Tax=Blastococcus saxobsidens TaxID=138336 RepID=A0A4Q7YAT9_9ACTN|nr:NAD(P)-dependent oxidoreductase [Blastococcus saxobsidens]RZU34160.1 3-hydroxyisobutyrate dehydrogenase [Blastococcus saxobsidens]